MLEAQLSRREPLEFDPQDYKKKKKINKASKISLKYFLA